MSKITKKYKFSIIQLYKASREIINIGIILYLNDKHTKYKIHLPINSHTAIKHSNLTNKQMDEVDNFYKLSKEERNLNNFPSSFCVTEPEFFTSSRYNHSTTDGLFNELKNTFITSEELLIEEADLNNLYSENILLKFTINTHLVNSQDMEYPGHSEVQVLIKYPYYNEQNEDEYLEEIGFLNFRLLDVEYDKATELLDYSDMTEHFIHLFDHYNYNSLKQKYINILQGYYGPYVDTSCVIPTILTKAYIHKKYRGNRLLKDVYKKVIELLNLEHEGNIVFFKAFDEDEKNTKKLKNYYEEVGFVALEYYMDGYIMRHPTSHVLTNDIQKIEQ